MVVRLWVLLAAVQHCAAFDFDDEEDVPAKGAGDERPGVTAALSAPAVDAPVQGCAEQLRDEGADSGGPPPPWRAAATGVAATAVCLEAVGDTSSEGVYPPGGEDDGAWDVVLRKVGRRAQPVVVPTPCPGRGAAP